MEEKRKQYYEFLTLIEEWENGGGGFTHPTIQQSKETGQAINEAANKIYDSYTRMYFIASPEVMEVAEELYLWLGITGNLTRDSSTILFELRVKTWG